MASHAHMHYRLELASSDVREGELDEDGCERRDRNVQTHSSADAGEPAEGES
jgi:hypothetical protein